MCSTTTSLVGATNEVKATWRHANTSQVASANGGRSRAGLRSLLAVVVAAAALLGVVVYRTVASDASSATSTAHYAYGGLPSWLPRSTLATGQALAASPAHPQLGIEGDLVKVALPTGSTWATMTGPQVPPFVAPPPPYTTATLTITLENTSGVVPLHASDFALIDGNGTVYRPATFVGGRTSVEVPARSRVRVKVREYLAIGSGSIRWAPAGRPVMTWEFTVEND